VLSVVGWAYWSELRAELQAQHFREYQAARAARRWGNPASPDRDFDGDAKRCWGQAAYPAPENEISLDTFGRPIARPTEKAEVRRQRTKEADRRWDNCMAAAGWRVAR